MVGMALAMTAAIACSVGGDFFVKQGATAMKDVSAGQFGGVIGMLHPAALTAFLRKSGLLRNGRLLLGIGLLTLHFIAFMTAMRLAAVTVVVPLMSCTYIATTILGRIVLNEKVTPLRWGGIAVIVAGVGVLGISTLGSPEVKTPRRGAVHNLANIVRKTDQNLSIQHLSDLAHRRR